MNRKAIHTSVPETRGCYANIRTTKTYTQCTKFRLPKLTFQVIRRTIATLAQKKGTVKDVQGVMRHSRVATTTDVYMQELPEGVRATVDSIHDELHATMAKLAGGSVTVH